MEAAKKNETKAAKPADAKANGKAEATASPGRTRPRARR